MRNYDLWMARGVIFICVHTNYMVKFASTWHLSLFPQAALIAVGRPATKSNKGKQTFSQSQRCRCEAGACSCESFIYSGCYSLYFTLRTAECEHVDKTLQ